MAKYRKLIAASVGLILLFIGPEGFGLVTEEQSGKIGEGIIAALTAYFVWRLPNDVDNA